MNSKPNTPSKPQPLQSRPPSVQERHDLATKALRLDLAFAASQHAGSIPDQFDVWFTWRCGATTTP
jgi:hypothetical protein